LSDGRQSVEQVIDTARKNRIGVIAFTDHDITMGADMFAKAAKSSADVGVVSGIEISSGLPHDLGGGDHSKFHITGLFVDPADKGLEHHTHAVRAAKVERTIKTVQSLNELGFRVSLDKVIAECSGGMIGYPHIVRVMMRDPRNVELVETYRRKMEQAAKQEPDVAMQYKKMILSGPDQYPYTLFFHHDSFVRGLVHASAKQPDMDKSVALIRNAGGVAILAHYYTVSSVITPPILRGFIDQGRLDGVETVFGLFELMPKSRESVQQEREIARDVVARTGCLPGGGADSHCKEDMDLFSQNAAKLGDTVGMARKIILRRNSAANSNLLGP
jgi:hypothetical protein